MNPIRRIGAAMAALTGALLALTTASAAYASLRPHGGGPAPAPARIWPIVIGGMPVPAYPRAPGGPPAQVHTFVSYGMPGWQITLIAIGAALAAAVVAVLLDRARAARRHRPATA
jgi:hypothetical protein